MTNLDPYTKIEEGGKLIEALVFIPSGILDRPVRVTFEREHMKLSKELLRTDFANAQPAVWAHITVEGLSEPDTLGVRAWVARENKIGTPWSNEAIILRALYLLPELRAAYFAKNR